MKNPASNRLLTSGEAAKILNKSPGMVRVYEKDGKLTAQRTIGGLRLFRERDVVALKEEQSQRRARAEARAITS